jgi:hypothetical protein
MQYGLRTGWNARGGTDAEHLRIDRQAARVRMDAALQPVLDALGVEGYLVWVDENLLDTDSIDQVILKANREVARLEQEAACSCNPLTVTACPACLRAMANDVEIPFA